MSKRKKGTTGQGKESLQLYALVSSTYVSHTYRTGPLKVFIDAGKLIPRTIDPWLSIRQIFTTSLTAEGCLRTEEWHEDEDNKDEDQDMYILSFFAKYMHLKMYARECELLENRLKSAYKKVLKLSSSMTTIVHRLCKLAEDNCEEVDETMLVKLIDLVSNVARDAKN